MKAGFAEIDITPPLGTLKIKEEVFPKRAWIVGQANGMVGYVPTREAFRRGGYETTFCGSSRLSPEAGDMIADGAIGLFKRLILPKDRLEKE